MPHTRPCCTHPPASFMRCTSARDVFDGPYTLCSEVRSIALPPRASTARESPTLAAKMRSWRTSSDVAVLPEKQSGGANFERCFASVASASSNAALSVCSSSDPPSCAWAPIGLTSHPAASTPLANASYRLSRSQVDAAAPSCPSKSPAYRYPQRASGCTTSVSSMYSRGPCASALPNFGGHVLGAGFSLSAELASPASVLEPLSRPPPKSPLAGAKCAPFVGTGA
mmetsp:Transcript_14463/g.60345  ORF Transcript_14463/g.60345 Transcript_14463/m.60345 type:complete len:226 (+) Transcript_14463:385-1062(+)